MYVCVCVCSALSRQYATVSPRNRQDQGSDFFSFFSVSFFLFVLGILFSCHFVS